MTKQQPALQLPQEQRDALTSELFASWQATEPEAHHCFCGSDRDLIEAVARIRAEQDRERG